MLPTQGSDMCHRRLCNLLAAPAQRRERFGEIDRIPGSNGCHQEMQATGPVHLIFQGAITQLPQAAKEELAGEGVQGFPFVQPNQNAPTQGLVAKILQQESGSFELAEFRQCPRDLILARLGRQLAHQQRSGHRTVTNGGSHAPHLIPLLHDEFPVNLAERQCPQRSRFSHLVEQIQFLGEGIADPRGKAEAEQRCQSKDMLRAYVDKFLAHLRVPIRNKVLHLFSYTFVAHFFLSNMTIHVHI